MSKYNSVQAVVIGYALTSVFCLAIAWLLWAIGIDSSFTEGLLISFSIGTSCMTAFALIDPPLQRYMPRHLSSIITIAIGLTVGLVIAGMSITDDPWFFLSLQEASLALGVFFSILGYFFFGTRMRLFELNAKMAKIQANEAAAAQQMAETELRLLQAQIEPHFLFNTLGNVSSMIHTNPDGAEQTLNNLSTLLRNSLRQTREPLTNLGEELRVLRAYLDIQKIRMGDRLDYHIQAPAELHGMPLAPLLLQPLVENAISHGIEPSVEGGSVDILVQRQKNKIQITVRDTGIGIVENEPSSGLGLRNVRERLQALYPGQANLKLMETKPNGVTVELNLPFDTTVSPALKAAATGKLEP